METINGQIDLFNNLYKIDKPIRLIEFFGGYGSQSLALKYLGVGFEHWKLCEWAIKSIQAYKDLHFENDTIDYSIDIPYNKIIEYLYNKGISNNYNEPMTFAQIKRLGETKCRNIYNNIISTHNLVNIQQVKAIDLNINNKDKYEYIMTYSFPCITRDSLILTKNGYKKYKDLAVGEYVLTKSNTWQKISKKFDNGIHKVYSLNAMGFENIECTSNHKFYVRTMKRIGHKQKRTFLQPEFKEAKDITNKDYFGVPVIQEENEFYTSDLDFWYMIGFYLGDGWLSNTGNDIKIACNDKKLEKLKSHLDINKWKYTYTKDNTCYKFRFSNKDIYKFIKKYIGTGCEAKHICGEILLLPKTQLEALFNGYLDSDGCYIKKSGNFQFSSVNRNLIYSMSTIVNKLYNAPTKIYKNVVNKKKNLCGRVVHQKDWYMLRFKKNIKKQDKAFYDNGYIWYPFKSLQYLREDNVYNMEVENDHSYIVQGCISKNCQDLSLAGKCAGMSKGSSTRSGMLWEVERILKELQIIDSLPQVLLMENVPQVHGKKNIQDFELWQKSLRDMGYTNYWKDINGKDFGIPQNRNRCFMVSILGDYKYEFPKPIHLEKKLKDLLENEVEEKYYLSDRAISVSLNTNFNVSKLENRCPKNGCFPTLCTRDYKDPKCVQVEELKVNIQGKEYNITKNCENYIEWHQKGLLDMETRAWKDDKVAPTILTGCVKIKVLEEQTLKRQLCNDLIKNGMVEEMDVIRHNYSNSRINGDMKDIKQNNISPTLDTRCDCLGICVNSNNKRLQQVAKKLNIEEQDTKSLDAYNNTIHDEMQYIKTTIDTSNMNFIYNNYRIRKLTPKECLRLMGVKDEDIDKMSKNQSNASLYHLAGDSIIVNVLMAIFENLLRC